MSDSKGTEAPLRELVAAALSSLARGPDALEEVTAWVAEGLREAQTRFPGVRLSDQFFLSHLAARAQGQGAVTTLAAARSLHLPELYLCAACAEGDATAQRFFDTQFLAQIREPVRRVQDSPVFEEEVTQLLREKLLLGLGGRPAKIRDYSGRGPLLAWLKAAAVRTALNHVQRHGREVGLEQDAWAQLKGTSDPELAVLRTRFKDQFSAAFERALAGLAQRDRNLLRLHLLDGVALDKLGVMFQVHRATVARWLALAREQLVERTKAELVSSLKMEPKELEELMGLLRSQLDVSIHRFLRKTASPS